MFREVPMLDWSRLDPRKFERGVQALLRRLHPDLVSLDGAGGDDGRDAERPLGTWQANDGTEVFEVKSHSVRLTNSQKRQITRSLTTAVAKLPAMRRWTLITGLNQSPAELTWMRTKLQELAPGVSLSWCGIDWLDGQMANHTDLARYIEGPESGLLRAAKAYGMEREVLAGGLPDLAARHAALQERADEMSPHWTIHTATGPSGQTFSLHPKHENAAVEDPILLRPLLEFRADDQASERAREQFEMTIGYGGVAELDETIVKDIEIDASEVVRQMLGDMAVPGRIRLGRPPQPLDRPYRATLEARDGGATGPLLASIELSLTTYTSGMDGGRVHGSDAAGTVAVRMQLPKPADREQTVIKGGEFNLNFMPPWDMPLADVVASLQLQAAVAEGAHVGLKASWAKMTLEQGHYDRREAKQARLLARAAIVLARLEELLDVHPTLPTEFASFDVLVAEAAVRALEGQRMPISGGTLTINIDPGAAAQHIKDSGSEPTQFKLAIPDYVLTLGEVQVPYGPYAIVVEKGRVVNIDEVLATPEDEPLLVVVEPVDGQMYTLTRDEALAELLDRGDAASLSPPTE